MSKPLTTTDAIMQEIKPLADRFTPFPPLGLARAQPRTTKLLLNFLIDLAILGCLQHEIHMDSIKGKFNLALIGFLQYADIQ